MKLRKDIHTKTNRPIYYIEDPKGQTYSIKELLKKFDFVWYRERKIWWRYADTANQGILDGVENLNIDISEIHKKQPTITQEPPPKNIQPKDENKIPELTNKTESDAGKIDKNWKTIPSSKYYGFNIKKDIYSTKIKLNINEQEIPVIVTLDRWYNKGRRKIPSYVYSVKYNDELVWTRKIKAPSEWGSYNEDEMAYKIPTTIQSLVDQKKILYKSMIYQLELEKRDPEFVKILKEMGSKYGEDFGNKYISSQFINIIDPKYQGKYNISVEIVGGSIWLQTNIKHPLAPRKNLLANLELPPTIKNLQEFEQFINKSIIENQKEIEKKYIEYLKSFPFEQEKEQESRQKMETVVNMIGKNYDINMFKNQLINMGYIRPSKKVKKELKTPGFVPQEDIKWVIESKKIVNDAYTYTQNPDEFYSTIAYYLHRKIKNISSWTDMMLTTAIEHWHKLTKRYGYDIKYEDISTYFNTIANGLYEELFQKTPPQNRWEQYQDFYSGSPQETSYTLTNELENFASFVQSLGINKKEALQNPKEVYRRLAMELHPDRNPNNPKATEQFKQLSVLYNNLPTNIIRAHNWYYNLKLAQIWNIESDGSFSDELSRLYGLEYKSSMIKNNEFRGNPQRKENILKKLNQELLESANNVRNPLINVFKNWLDNHALLSPQIWAQQRTFSQDSYDEIDSLQSMQDVIYEYTKYSNPNQNLSFRQKFNPDKTFNEMLQIALNNIQQYPTLIKLRNIFFEGEKEDNLKQLELKEFNEMYITQFTDRYQMEEYIDNMDPNNFDLADCIYSFGLEEFISMASNHIDIEPFIMELYQNLVFPLWHNYWKEQGIEETRKNIEKIYKNLLQTNKKSFGQILVDINIAINTAHQTGDMIEYIEEELQEENIRELFDGLSGGQNISKWNEELKEIGVEI